MGLSNTAGTRIVGYDLRRAPEMAPVWPSERVERHLLRWDAAHPLSTDTTVWESFADLASSEKAEWHGVLGLWSKVSDLLRFARSGSVEIDLKGWWLIAVGLPLDVLVTADRERWLSPGKMVSTSPDQPASEWELLGYDVSDEWLLSGLTNCGYSGAEVPSLRKEWSSHLNDHHLFAQVEDAIAFKALSDTRVPEHAPFQPFALYRIPVG